VFAVVVTGAPGAGKTAALIRLSDALIDDQIAHAAVDVDEVAWAYPFPDLDARCARLAAAWGAHREAGHDLLLVGEVVESNDHLAQILGSVGAEDHLLVLLEAAPATMHERIVAREPPGWSGLDHLLGEVERYAASLPRLDGVHAVCNTEQLAPDEVTARIRAARPDLLGG
jgi:broad-specificity NMP kinase